MRQPLAIFLALLLLLSPIAIADGDESTHDEMDTMAEEVEATATGVADTPNKRPVKIERHANRLAANSRLAQVKDKQSDGELSETRKKQLRGARALNNAQDVRAKRANLKDRLNNNVDDVEAFADLDDEQKAKLRKLSRARRAALAESGDIDAELADVEIKPASEVNFNKRRVAKDRMKELRDFGKQARDQYKKDRDAFKERKAAFAEKRDELKECDEETQDCDALREEVFSEAQQTLMKAIDAYIKRMEALKSKVEESDTLSDAQVERITNWIDKRIGLAERMHSAAESAESKEDLRKVAKAFERLVNSTKSKIVSTATGNYGRTVFKVLKRAEHFDARLQCSVDEGADLDLADFQSGLAATRVALEDAKELHEAGDHEGARESISLAKKELREAVNLGKELMKELREQGLSLSDCEVAVDEDEEFADIEVEEDEGEIEEIEALLEDEE